MLARPRETRKAKGPTEANARPTRLRDNWPVRRAAWTRPPSPHPVSARSACPTFLALAGVENPAILIAEQAVQSSLALQMRARVLLLPDLNVGGDYDNHTGRLQSSYGEPCAVSIGKAPTLAWDPVRWGPVR